MRIASLAFAAVAAFATPALADEPVPSDPPPQPETPAEPALPAPEPTPQPEPVPGVEGPGQDRPTVNTMHGRTVEITVIVPGERSRMNKIVLGSMAAAGFLLGGLGLKYHLDSRDYANQVSADAFTGRPWSAENQTLVDKAGDARGSAAIAYTLGGALVVGAITAFIITEPKKTRETLRPRVSLVSGGATIGGAWSW